MRMMQLAMMMLLWVIATPALGEPKERIVIPRVGVGMNALELEGKLSTYARLDIAEFHSLRRRAWLRENVQRQPVNPMIGGVGFDVSSNWDNLTSFGFSSIGGWRMFYASMGFLAVHDQNNRRPLDGGVTWGLHTPTISFNYWMTVRGGERGAMVVLVLDPKFWIGLFRNQRQFNKATTSHSYRE